MQDPTTKTTNEEKSLHYDSDEYTGNDSDDDRRADIEDVYAEDDRKFREGEPVPSSTNAILNRRKENRKMMGPVVITDKVFGPVKKLPVEEMAPLPSLLPANLKSTTKSAWSRPQTKEYVVSKPWSGLDEKGPVGESGQQEPPQRKKVTMPDDVKQTYQNTRMCDFAQNCKRAKCTFAHTLEEFSPMECNFDRRCRNRETCRFKHSDETKEEFVSRLGIKARTTVARS